MCDTHVTAGHHSQNDDQSDDRMVTFQTGDVSHFDGKHDRRFSELDEL